MSNTLWFIVHNNTPGRELTTTMKFAENVQQAIQSFPPDTVCGCASDEFVQSVVEALHIAYHEVRDVPPPARMDDPPGSGLPREPSDEQAASALRVLMRANATERIDPNLPHAGKDRWQMIEAGRNRNVAHNLNIVRRWWNVANAVDKAAR